MEDLDILRAMRDFMDSKHGNRIVVHDLRGISDVCSYQIICSGSSDVQTKAIARAVKDGMKKEHSFAADGIEGLQLGEWILIDYKSILVHVFVEESRDFYALEDMWSENEIEL